jgi:hypothetical protein
MRSPPGLEQVDAFNICLRQHAKKGSGWVLDPEAELFVTGYPMGGRLAGCVGQDSSIAASLADYTTRQGKNESTGSLSYVRQIAQLTHHP